MKTIRAGAGDNPQLCKAPVSESVLDYAPLINADDLPKALPAAVAGSLAAFGIRAASAAPEIAARAVAGHSVVVGSLLGAAAATRSGAAAASRFAIVDSKSRAGDATDRFERAMGQ